MLVGSKAQSKSLNVDDFILKYEGMPLRLVENAKYLGMSINFDISWDFHVQRLCQNTYYHLSLLRRIRRLFPKDLLLQVYKSYIQPRLDGGITLSAHWQFLLHKLSWNWPYQILKSLYHPWKKRLFPYNIDVQSYPWDRTHVLFRSRCYKFWCKWLWHQRVRYGFISPYTTQRGLSK